MANPLVIPVTIDATKASASINKFFAEVAQQGKAAAEELQKEFGEQTIKEVKIVIKGDQVQSKTIEKLGKDTQKVVDAQEAYNGKLSKTSTGLKKQLNILKTLRDDTEKYAGTTNKLTKEWKAVNDRVKVAAKELDRLTNGQGLERMRNGLKGIGAKFALIQTAANLLTTAVIRIGQAMTQAFSEGMEMEQLFMQLEAFTGSTEAAQKQFEEFAVIAAESPFDLKQVANAGKILMGFGFSAESATENTRRLAIIAGATGGELTNLTRNLGQIQTQGRAYTRDLTQFAIQGIPIWTELSKVTGKSTVELKEMAKAGQIGMREVSAAIENLTSETSAFAQIAEKNKETFKGLFAQIESGAQQFAKGFIDSLNMIDKFLGGVVKGSLKLFADSLAFIGKNATEITKAFLALTVAVGAFVVVSNFGAILGFLRSINLVLGLQLVAQLAINAALFIYNALTGNFAAIAAAVAVGATAYAGMSHSIKSAAREQLELNKNMMEGNAEVGRLTEQELAYARAIGKRQEVQNYEEAVKDADKLKEAIASQIELVKQAAAAEKERRDKEIAGIQEVIEKKRDEMDSFRDDMKEKIDAEKDLHDQKINALQDIIDQSNEVHNQEIANLRAKTPAEQELYDLRKRQLKADIESGRLSGEDLIRARAKYERMLANEKIAAKETEHKKKQKGFEEQMKTLRAEKKSGLDAIKKVMEDGIEVIKEDIQRQEEKIQKLKDAQTAEDERVKQAIRNAKNYDVQQQIAEQTLKRHLVQLSNLEGKWRKAEAAVRKYREEVAKANKEEQNSSNNQYQPKESEDFYMAAGGPISGGSTAIVNEKGQEAFLTAAGKLSMINAPAFGKWKAPTSGTVIPAHLTSQLDIPSGGININQSASTAAMSSSDSSGSSALLRALKNNRAGDKITNNVTIQATNTTQAASDMLVELTKIKRRRYS